MGNWPLKLLQQLPGETCWPFTVEISMCTIRTVPSPHPVHNVTTVYSFTRILGTIFGFHARERAYLEMILGISTKVYSTQQKPEIIPFNRSLLCPCARDGNFVVWPFAPAINSDRAPLGSNGHWSRPVESSFWSVEFLFYWSGRSTATQSISLSFVAFALYPLL
jgi:hypothetical protein